MAGLSEVPVLILDADELRAASMTLIENLQREDLNPIEEAAGYKTLMTSFDLTQEDVAERVGRSRSAVANTLRLLSLPDTVREMVESGTLSAGHARTLLSLPEELRESAAKYAVENALSVREFEAYCKRIAAPAKQKRATVADIYAGEVGRRLSSAMGRRITLKPGRKRGKLEIEYYGNDDLETLIALLESAAER
jgi:ParB family chromosome partitioning protein